MKFTKYQLHSPVASWRLRLIILLLTSGILVSELRHKLSKTSILYHLERIPEIASLIFCHSVHLRSIVRGASGTVVVHVSLTTVTRVRFLLGAVI